MTDNLEDQLKKQGWIRQFTASEPRLSEAIELYESLGYEVKVESAFPDKATCSECLLKGDCKTIYIRAKINLLSP